MADMVTGRRNLDRRPCGPNRTAIWTRGVCFVGAAFLAGAHGVVLAQTPVTIPNEDGGAVQYVIAGLIMLVISITGFLKAHRSHKA